MPVGEAARFEQVTLHDLLLLGEGLRIPPKLATRLVSEMAEAMRRETTALVDRLAQEPAQGARPMQRAAELRVVRQIVHAVVREMLARVS